MLTERDRAKIVTLEAKHSETGELSTAMGQGAETGEIKLTQPYWFKCPACSFDWQTWIRPSIVFVSLAFVTDKCPNCQRKHVPAYKGGAEKQPI
jgi:hypothetical protein